MAKLKKKQKPAQERYTVKNAVVNYYLLLMLTVFPLFYTDQHVRIRHDKLYMFYVLSGLLIVCTLLVLLVYFFDRNKIDDKTSAKWYLELSFTDCAFGAFVLCCVISTVLSDYPLYAFRGIWYDNTGRNNGLLLILCYFLVYIIVSRAYSFKQYVFVAGAFCAVVVFVLAVMHYLYIDPLGMYKGYTARSVENFMSTIGNKNLVSCFCCLTVPLFSVLYIYQKNKLIKALFALTAAFGFAAMMCADSDSGPLGLVPVMAVILLFCVRDSVKLRDFMALSALMFAASKLVWIVYFLSPRHKGLGYIQDSVLNGALGWIMLCVFALFAAALTVVIYLKPGFTLPGVTFGITVGLFIAAAAVLVGLFIYFTFIDTQTPLSSSMKLFRFDDKWGTHRGFMWRRSLEIFKGFGIKDKLFGCGPDTFYSAFAPYFDELYQRFGDGTTNCAHNEFINYLITTGILGLSAYIATFVSALVAAFKAVGKNFLALAFGSSVLCYLLQSTVNIATPIVTPLLFVFLSLVCNINRRVKISEADDSVFSL